MRKLIKALRPWLVPIVIAMILAVASTVCSIVGPKLLGQMTDTALMSYSTMGSLDWGKLGSIAWMLIALYVGSAILGYIEGVILSIVAARFAKKMRAEIIAKIMRLPISYFDQHLVGDILSRMSNDVATMAQTFANVTTKTITSVTTIIGIMVMMLTISVPLTLIALVVVPVTMMVIGVVAKRAQKYFRAQQETLGELNSVIEEDFSGQLIIKAMSHQKASEQKFAETNERLYQTAWKAQFLGTVAFPLTHLFTHVNYVLICVVGGDMAIKGTLLIGGVQAFIQYVNQFNHPLTEISQIVANIQQVVASAERVFGFLEEKEESREAKTQSWTGKIRGEVEFDKVNFAYSNAGTTIKDFSVKVKPGMQVAIVGPTGAGKTTMINLLMRFYDPVSGEIRIDGVPTTKLKRADVRKMFGMVLQDTWLFAGTIEENLKYGNPEATSEEIVEAAKRAHVHHFIESLPDGYKTVIDEDSDNISAGEKQLLTIVRAMIADPPMMILDEATSNVDTLTEQLIQEAFRKLTHGRTSFVIAHRLSTVRNADLIIVMKDGAIVEQGKHEELLKKGGFYAEIYNSQF